jgi:hypothetical protein
MIKPGRNKGNPHNKPVLDVDRKKFRRLRRLFGGAVLLISKDKKR